MRAIVTDGVALCVCLSVCPVGLLQSWALQNTWTDQDAVWNVDSGGSKEPVLDGVRIPPRESAILTGNMLSPRHMAGWDSDVNNSSTTESELWRNAGPSALQLQETVLKTW